ncbi:MAG: helix-turn-helix domain-containing protein [Acidimicrobiales bacterium]
MTGGVAIRRARTRAGITQAELARRLGTPASVLSRWEHEGVEPSFRAVDRAVTACGLELASLLREDEPDPQDLSLIDTAIHMSPSTRLQRLIDTVRFIEAGRL